MGKVMAVTNHKGGVGKTAVTLGLADAFAVAGKQVLIIDMDPRADATKVLSDGTAPELTLNDVLFGDASLNGQVAEGAIVDAVIPANEAWPNVFYVPSEQVLSAREHDATIGKEYRLRSALEGMTDRWDVVLIDCPPSLGSLSLTALTAADTVVAVTEPADGSADSVNTIVSTIGAVKRTFNADLTLSGLVVNKHKPREKDPTYWLQILRDDYGSRILEPVILSRASVPQAHTEARPLTAYGARTKDVTDAFKSLAAQLDKE